MKLRLCLVLPALALVTLRASADTPSSLSAGGLAPPAPLEPAPVEAPPSATEQQLSRADREDAGRGLEFVFLDAEGGVQHLGLETLHGSELVDGDLIHSTGTGALFGAGAGLRLIFLTAGARFRLENFSDYRLWTLGLEFGLRIPMGALEPYFTLSGGYASLGAFDTAALGAAGVGVTGLSARGFDLRGGGGVDYYLGPTLSVGANLSGDLLFLSRSKQTITPTAGAGSAAQHAAVVYARDASSIGAGASLTARVGLHF
jgi:hypothetical protein